MRRWRSISAKQWTLQTLLRRHPHILQRTRRKQPRERRITLWCWTWSKNLRDKLSALNLDNANIRAACDALRRQCQDQGVAFGDLSQLVRQSLEGRQFQQPREETGRPHSLIRPDLIDSRGNLRATDIGITWQGSDTFLHGVRVAGPEEDIEDTRHRPAMSTPYPPVREHPSCGMSTPRHPRPVCMEISETPTHRTGQEGRPSHRPAEPIQQQNHRVAGLVPSFQSCG